MDEKETNLGIKKENMLKLTQGASGHFSMFVSFHVDY